ncbi:hypothetical protein XAXN_12205 [Xanthomonas axonopodis]|uniref:RiboL-PSP-HEPN domain-containing protein n=1 Tax=Xanthomonas axonopodis TaxID=53413 RepID=A0A0P6W396_9XANT|nr:hypothetical protein [Xanthomonas axonopodis]KPL48674.1 hypothetical protein XAXN_12205 [Xanthomonas axonopodis]
MNFNLLNALERADMASISDRAERIEWLAKLEQPPVPFLNDDIESLTLLNEAKNCFKRSLDIAAVLTATAYIEMTLADELREAGNSKRKLPLGEMITEIRKIRVRNVVLSQEFLDNLELLVKKRNAYAHRKEANDLDHTLGHRLITEQKHPRTVMREDAELAMKLMYELFYRTLHSCPS